MTAVDDELKPPGDRSLAEELIDDRALEDAEQDLLHHKDIVDELEQLVCATEVPANVALYGAWGSGKSSLANILGARLRHREVPVPFARFDAFKYADGPLRRLFISRVAAELGVTGDPGDPEDRKEQKQKYGSGLYTAVTKSTLSLPDTSFWKLVGTFVLAVLCGLAAIAALLAIIVLASNWGWNADEYRKLIGRALVIGSIPAAMIAVLTALANRTLPVDQTRSAPSSEEEFERLFRELVKEVMDSSDAERIVIVIDELDRCSSDEVVKTLETVRTFLDVSPCVVVVAADQQVLEQALRKQARQETPSDRRNPYYSGGSAYLDKIFSYPLPLPLPQLRSRRLSDFSLDLIKPLGGLWKHIDPDWVLFALIPTHIRSPRRVKALLNAFVLAHRLAERRSADGFLPPDIHKRAAEIAKLTCLRIEFPLFGADLTIHPRLPEFVLALHLDPDAKLPPYVSQDLEDLARDYAERKLDVDDVLSREEDPGPAREDGEEDDPATDQANPGNGDAPQTARDRADAGDEDSSTHVRTPDAVRLAQGQHLLDYLQRTEQVGEIGSDLIFLEGRGTTFGIDAARADELVTAAVNGDWRVVSRAFGRAENEDETKALLRLLAREARDADLARRPRM